jgi:hypothetical protein
MKKLKLFLLLITLPVLLNAQGIRFSFLTNPQFSWFNAESKNIDNDGVRTGMKFGLHIDNFFAEHYAFSYGIFLNSTGGRLKFAEKTLIRFDDNRDSIPQQNTLTYRLNYFSLPVGLKLTTREIGYSTFFINTGFDTQVRFKAKADLASLDYSREAITEEISLFSFSWFLGAGVKYSIGGHTALIGGLSYTGGLTSVLTNDDLNASINSLQIQIGILF